MLEFSTHNNVLVADKLEVGDKFARVSYHRTDGTPSTIEQITVKKTLVRDIVCINDEGKVRTSP